MSDLIGFLFGMFVGICCLMILISDYIRLLEQVCKNGTCDKHEESKNCTSEVMELPKIPCPSDIDVSFLK